MASLTNCGTLVLHIPPGPSRWLPPTPEGRVVTLATTSVPAREAATVAETVTRVATTVMPVTPGMTVIVDPDTVRRVLPIRKLDGTLPVGVAPRYRAMVRVVHGATGLQVRYRARLDGGGIRFTRVQEV